MKNRIATSLILLLLACPATGRAGQTPDSLSVRLTQTIEGIVVTGTRNRTDPRHLPMTVSVVGRERIERSREASLLPLLTEQVPGLFTTARGVMGYGVSGGAAGQMSLRGIGGAPQAGVPTTGLLVLIDGHPQYMGLMGHDDDIIIGWREIEIIGEETSEQLDIVPMQIRVLKHVRKIYGCRGCETAPVTADKPAQLIEKSMASPSVLAMLLIVTRVRLVGDKLLWLLASFVLVGTLLFSAPQALQHLPALFIPGQGVTPFKANIEYGICAANLALAVWLLLHSRHERHPRSLWLATSCVIMGIGELAFTNYHTASDFLKLFGHLYEVVAYAYIYRAIFLAGVHEPYQRMALSEQRIRTQEHELNTLLHNLPSGIARLDSTLRLRYLNPALANHLTRSSADALNHPIADALPGDIQQQAMPYLLKALSGERSGFDLEYLTASGQQAWALASVIPEKDAEGRANGVLAIVTDTTERERTRRDLAKSLREPLLKIFPPALLGRLVTIPYYPLSDEMLGKIVRLQLNRIKKRVENTHKVAFDYDDAVIDLIVSRCTETESGGRMIDTIQLWFN